MNIIWSNTDLNQHRTENLQETLRRVTEEILGVKGLTRTFPTPGKIAW